MPISRGRSRCAGAEDVGPQCSVWRRGPERTPRGVGMFFQFGDGGRHTGQQQRGQTGGCGYCPRQPRSTPSRCCLPGPVVKTLFRRPVRRPWANPRSRVDFRRRRARPDDGRAPRSGVDAIARKAVHPHRAGGPRSLDETGSHPVTPDQPACLGSLFAAICSATLHPRARGHDVEVFPA